MKKLLGLAAVLEAATGLALMIHPPLVTWLLLGDEVSGAGEALGRVAGFAFFGRWGWPAGRVSSLPALNNPALRALLAYNLLATLYLTYLGIGGRLVGSLLWPAVVIHAVLTLLLARAWRASIEVERVKQ